MGRIIFAKNLKSVITNLITFFSLIHNCASLKVIFSYIVSGFPVQDWPLKMRMLIALHCVSGVVAKNV